MGFDNECILNIQSLAGEYFCPVCRLLVYPNEALQSQCTHLYCKPCLTYVVSTTRACPYDGYLVTETDSKPLIESNKALAETIGKIAVHCLYHRSGCTWQGQFSDCTTHCVSCPFGNSPVVCNRCGTQIVHRQVQEHAQNCPGVQPQAPLADGAQDSTVTATSAAAATTEHNQTASQAATQASQSQPSQVAAAPTSGQDQTQASVTSQPQAVAQAVPAAEQWYQQQQQQYQQYYQQYPGYDPSQQYYQQYDPYQQQTYQQYQQHLHTHSPYAVQGHYQPQVYLQPQPQPQPQAQPQLQPQMQVQSSARPQPQPQPQLQPPPQPQAQAQAQAQAHASVAVQPAQVQAQLNPQSVALPHSQMQQQPYPPSQGQQHPQLYPQTQPPVHLQPQQVPLPPHPQQRPHLPAHQQPQPQMHHPQPHQHPHPQPQLHLQPQIQQHTQAPMQPQPQAQSLPQSHPLPQPQHSSSHAVTGHQSYPQTQPQQQIPPGAPQQHHMPMHPQQQGMPQQPLQLPGHAQPFPPQQLPQMRPPQSNVPMQQHQQPAMQPVRGQHPNMPSAQQPLHSHAHAPGQPIHQHPGLHPPYQQPAGQQVHGHAQQTQSFASQTSGLVHSQPHQTGPFVPQPTMQPPLRPQGPPPSLQQHALAHPPLQQNVPVSHGLQPHQSQIAGRPLMPNQGLQHQQFPSGTVGSHSKSMQSGAVQPYPPRINARPQSSSVQQQSHIHQSGVSQSGTENAAIQSVTKTHGSTVKTELKADRLSQKPELKEEDGLLARTSQGVCLSELKIPRLESELKSVGVEEKAGNADENEPISDVKEISESLKVPEKDLSLLAKEDLEEPKTKLMVKDEASALLEPSVGGIVVENEVKDGGRETENSQQEDKEIQEGTLQKNVPLQKTEVLELMQKDAERPHVGSDTGSLLDRKTKSVIPLGPMPGSERNNMQAVPVKSDPSQLPPQSLIPSQERMVRQPGHHERNMVQSQPPHQGVGHMQQYGPPHMQDRVNQRPHVPDQMLRPPMPPAHQMQVPGQLPHQMRPQGPNIPGGIPVQGQPSLATEHYPPSLAKQPPGVPPDGFIGPGSSSLLGRGPAPLGPPQRGFESNTVVPQGHLNQAHLPPPHAAVPRIHGDQMGRPPLGAPVPGAFDSQGGLIARGPPHGPDGHIRPPVPGMESEILGNQRPVYFDGGQPDSHHPGSVEHVPFGQSSNMPPNITKMNGGPGKRLASGLLEPSIPFGSQEDRFKPLTDDRFKRLPEEGFNLLPEDRFKPFPIEPGRRIIDRREFEEDLNQFPRPAHLDSEGVPKFSNYFSRPLDREPHGLDSSDGDPRLLPPYQPGSLRPLDLRDDNMGRKVDTAGVRGDFLRSATEPGRHRIDGLLPLRSPGREYPGLPPSRFGRQEDSDSRQPHAFGERSKSFNLPSEGNAFHENRFPILPSHQHRGEFDGTGNLRIGELAGFGGFPNRSRFNDAGGIGSIHSNLRVNDSFGGNLHSHARGVEPGFSSNFPIHGYKNDGGFFNAGDLESFDLSRKRKPGSMGWCRICKVDCETVEGLDMHSQTREHQKMAMDMVLSIKKGNAKKQKISSDDRLLHDDGNKSRKANFESRGN